MKMNTKQATSLAAALIAGVIFSGSAWAAPKYNPDNGHFYDVINTPANWNDAKTDAESRTFFGLSGHLATITSQAEQDFLVQTVNVPGRAIIGAYQTDKTAEPAGNWAWVTGETWSFTLWNGGEPNNSGGGEDCAHLWPIANRAWNDIPCTFVESNYVIEYEGEGIEGQAAFVVTKEFSDGLTDEVEVTLTCNGGLPLQQSFTIAGGDEDGVGFIVTNLPQGGADCSVTESGGPDGYTAEFNGGAGCSWDDVTSGVYGCTITNTADNATYTVVKNWVQEGMGGDIVSERALVTIMCDAQIDDLDPYQGYWYKEAELGDGGTLEASVDVSTGPAECSASESIRQSGVESAAEGCGPTSLGAGDSHTCTFTNTVFFEGIPTLSQWGLALMALLMLSVGFVGLRRFV